MSTGEYDLAIRSAMVEPTVNFPIHTRLETRLASVTAAAAALMPGIDYADVMPIDRGPNNVELNHHWSH